METNFSQETVDTLVNLYEFRIDALQNKIEKLKAILKIKNLY
jgi:hypothetical protein